MMEENKKGSRKLALIERDRKMSIISKWRAEGYTFTEIAEKTGFKVGTVSSYVYLMNRDMAVLANEMDPKKLSAKKAEIINGLCYDLTLTHEQIEKSQKGYSAGKGKGKKVNEMAIASLIRQSVEIRMKIASLLGLSTIEVTHSGEIKHILEVKSSLPIPSAAIMIGNN